MTAYDATYLALAETLDANLLTLDERLAAAAGHRALPRRPARGHAESPASYESTVATELASHGAWLARLRSQIAS